MTKTLRWMVPAMAVLALGCANYRRPDAQLAQADLAVRDAEQADASRLAPLEMRLARDKLGRARAAIDDDDNLRARRLAEQALADAQLAESRARAEKAERTAREARHTVGVLESEATRGVEVSPPSRAMPPVREVEPE
jgi:hypothetical protein